MTQSTRPALPPLPEKVAGYNVHILTDDALRERDRQIVELCILQVECLICNWDGPYRRSGDVVVEALRSLLTGEPNA